MGGLQILEDGIGIKNHFAARIGTSLFLRCPHFLKNVGRRIHNGLGLEHRHASTQTADGQRENTRFRFVGYVPFMIRQTCPERVEGRARTMCWPHQYMIYPEGFS